MNGPKDLVDVHRAVTFEKDILNGWKVIIYKPKYKMGTHDLER